MLHRIARDELDVSLRQLVRSGHHIDSLTLDDKADEWIVITVDQIETRMSTITHSARLGVV